jgi:peptidyl-prolyl cis-trans isomerase SurA
MKYQLIPALVLIASTVATAQMASHAPTNKSALPSTQMAAVQVSGKPVAKVNDTVLTDKDLLREMYAIFPYGKQHNGFPKAQEEQIRQGALQMIIFEELVYQEALRRKMSVPAAQVDRGAAAYRQQFESPDQFQQYMQTEMHGSQQEFRRQIERSMLIDQLLKQEVDGKAVVTLADVRAYYDKNPARFQLPESFTFQAISIVPPPNSTPEQIEGAGKRADAALKQAKGTHSYQDFGLLAEKISEDDYRVNMGDHKAVGTDKLPPQVLDAFKTMKAGDVSGLIQIETAYTIVRLNAHTPAHQRSFEEVKVDLRKELQQGKSEQLRMTFDKRLRAKAKIELV